jgi:hypothetical protein
MFVREEDDLRVRDVEAFGEEIFQCVGIVYGAVQPRNFWAGILGYGWVRIGVVTLNRLQLYLVDTDYKGMHTAPSVAI